MKTRLILMALLISVASLVNAQDSKAIEKAAKAKTEQMVNDLKLTEDQETLVYRQNYVLETQLAKYSALPKETDKDKKNLEQHQNAYNESLKNILNEDQYETYKAMTAKPAMQLGK